MDVLNKEQRHKAMSHIKSQGTSIELALRKVLWENGYRYRKNYARLPGKPDIALTKYKIAIFCDGELFHGKNWEILRPKLLMGNNPDFWVKKIERNMERDQENDKKLLFMGWTVIHFWGNDIMKDPEACLQVVKEAIFDNSLKEMPVE